MKNWWYSTGIFGERDGKDPSPTAAVLGIPLWRTFPQQKAYDAVDKIRIFEERPFPAGCAWRAMAENKIVGPDTQQACDTSRRDAVSYGSVL